MSSGFYINLFDVVLFFMLLSLLADNRKIKKHLGVVDPPHFENVPVNQPASDFKQSVNLAITQGLSANDIKQIVVECLKADQQPLRHPLD
jgi:SpoVK/Ycf46/Vps4 family AAA+-type ATPase